VQARGGFRFGRREVDGGVRSDSPEMSKSAVPSNVSFTWAGEAATIVDSG
jgi:hypothetical protein